MREPLQRTWLGDTFSPQAGSNLKLKFLKPQVVTVPSRKLTLHPSPTSNLVTMTHFLKLLFRTP